jgi:hypothetical protein
MSRSSPSASFLLELSGSLLDGPTPEVFSGSSINDFLKCSLKEVSGSPGLNFQFPKSSFS